MTLARDVSGGSVGEEEVVGCPLWGALLPHTARFVEL